MFRNLKTSGGERGFSKGQDGRKAEKQAGRHVSGRLLGTKTEVKGERDYREKPI